MRTLSVIFVCFLYSILLPEKICAQDANLEEGDKKKYDASTKAEMKKVLQHAEKAVGQLNDTKEKLKLLKILANGYWKIDQKKKSREIFEYCLKTSKARNYQGYPLEVKELLEYQAGYGDIYQAVRSVEKYMELRLFKDSVYLMIVDRACFHSRVEDAITICSRIQDTDDRDQAWQEIARHQSYGKNSLEVVLETINKIRGNYYRDWALNDLAMRYIEVHENFETAEIILKRMKNPSHKEGILQSIAWKQLRTGKIKEAKATYRKIVNLAKKLPDGDDSVDLKDGSLVTLRAALGEKKTALKEMKTWASGFVRNFYLHLIAVNCIEQDDIQTALKITDLIVNSKAKIPATQPEKDEEVSKIAIALWVQGHTKEALEVVQKIKSPSKQQLCYLKLAWTNWEQKVTSADMQLPALIKDIGNRDEVYRRLCIRSSKQNQYEKSLTLLKNIDSTSTIIKTLGRMAFESFDNKKFDQAERYLKMKIEIVCFFMFLDRFCFRKNSESKFDYVSSLTGSASMLGFIEKKEDAKKILALAMTFLKLEKNDKRKTKNIRRVTGLYSRFYGVPAALKLALQYSKPEHRLQALIGIVKWELEID